MELKFMYDLVFSKSYGTAFRKRGIVLRLLKSCRLMIKKPEHKTVTFVLISVTLAIEVIQMCRIGLSDWAMVSLICSKLSVPGGGYRFKVIDFVINVLCGAKQINQYCMYEARSGSLRCIFKVANLFGIRSSLVPLYISNDFKSLIFEIVKDKCSPEQDIQRCTDRVYDPDEYLTTENCLELKEMSEMQLEDVILVWHINTSICEVHDRVVNSIKFKFVRIFSRYFSYLLVVQRHVLPLHGEIIVLAYINLQEKIFDMSEDVSEWTMDNDKARDIAEGNENVKNSIILAEQLRDM
ncbi:hypothetical protein SUGI_0722430 [Cryptomeria japonica]|nr:hypothetical protein SUGI_0722430 [Cryptomeria japonica]